MLNRNCKCLKMRANVICSKWTGREIVKKCKKTASFEARCLNDWMVGECAMSTAACE